MLTFPEYFDVNEYWLDTYKPFFPLFIFAMSLPSFFYSASDYVSAYKSIRSKMLNIDIPIALGIIVMFVRSGRHCFFLIMGLVFLIVLLV
jgi:Cu+-exporting ATPase